MFYILLYLAFKLHINFVNIVFYRPLNDFKVQNTGVTYNEPNGKTKYIVGENHPRQYDNISCGYFVLRYMYELVAKNGRISPRSSYQETELLEIIIMWCEYVYGFVND